MNENQKETKEKKTKKPGKLRTFFSLLKQNIISMHRFVWGTGWRRFIFAVVITIVILVVLLGVALELTSTPRFCNTCHNMKPYYASWVKSSHKDVTCTDCHFPPGLGSKLRGKFTALSMLVNYFTGVYKRSKPWAEISDESCMRSGCHEFRTLAGRVPFKKNIIFDHAPHLTNLRRGKTLRCTSCHSQIVQGSHMTVTESTCFLCHFKKTEPDDFIDTCTKCHIPPVEAKSADGTPSMVPYDHKMVLEREISCQKCHGQMVVGDGTVPKMRCSSCHSDREKIKHYNDDQLMHKNHITDHKIECDQCHTEVQHKSVARSEAVKPDCHACHPDFHNAQLYMFTGKGGKGIPEHPSPMFESGLNCQACHLYHQAAEGFDAKGQLTLANAKSCEPCHGTGYNEMLERWKNQTERGISRLKGVLDTAKTAVENNKSHAGYTAAGKKLADAEYNYNLVKFGNSIHNIAFANKLMQKAYDLAQEGMQDVGSSKKLPVFRTEAPITPGDCSNCHVGLELKKLEVFGWKYSHENHLKKHGLACSKCHSNEQKHGQLIIAKHDCMNCHHPMDATEKQLDCKTCHSSQHAIYYSELEFYTFKIPNSMVKDVACLDCHQDEDDKLYRPKKAVCSNCHEVDYEEMFVEWENTSIDLLKRLREKVRKENLDKGNKAYDILMLLERDGSKGIHNPELYEKLVEEALK
jgi:nitrate/TMAO reductase-like tetraheme cytochrome c subunit